MKKNRILIVLLVVECVCSMTFSRLLSSYDSAALAWAAFATPLLLILVALFLVIKELRTEPLERENGFFLGAAFLAVALGLEAWRFFPN